jgi:SAM-dependent methyltransferase
LSKLNHNFPSAVKYYDQNLLSLFESYESLSFQAVHREFLRFLPALGERCLDIGAGSGRDAAALAHRGYSVVAVEPSDGFRKLAIKTHQESSIEWVNDKLPNLTVIMQMGSKFKFILLSAVWMHLQPCERLTAIKVLAELLEKKGFLAISLRFGPANTDRAIYPVSVDELLALASQVGLKAVYKSREHKDSLNRSGVQWRKLVLSKV